MLVEIVASHERVADFLLDPLAQGLLSSISDGVIIIDAADRRVVAMNEKARELLEYSEDGVLGSQCKDMMESPACTMACPLTALLEGRSEGGELDLYYRGRGKDKLLHAHTRMILVRDSDGEAVAGIEIFKDLRDLRRLERRLGEKRSLRGLIGASPAMQFVFDTIEQVAPYDIPILITGDSGVGKELAASAIHYHSRRAAGPYFQLNCATLSPELTSSELFGHRRGAFTGASADRRGFFEQADGGTLFLDEVGELSPDVQAKLLQVLQDGQVQRLGEERPRRVDVRVLAATNRRLQTEVAEGRFRADLYYRLAGATIHIPPLHERKEDIRLLAEHFLRQLGKELDRPSLSLGPDALEALIDRPWPGNARELQNVLRLAAIRAEDGVIDAVHLEEGHVSGRASRPVSTSSPTLAEIEQKAMDDALREAEGNVTEAAKRLGIDRTTLWRKMKRGPAA